MAKKRGIQQPQQGAQQSTQETGDERIDSGTVPESDAGTLPGTEEAGAIDGNPGIGEAGAEGSETPADQPLQEEGLVGDESDVPKARGMDPHVATLDEAGFMAVLTPEGEVVVDDKILEQPGIEELADQVKGKLVEELNDRIKSGELTPEPEPAGIPVEVQIQDLSEVVQTPLDIADAVEVKPVSQWTTGALRADLEGKVGKDAAAAWSREQMLTFLETGAYPKKTHRQNWVYDARRTHMVRTWSSTEMMDFIDGLLVLDKGIDQGLVWEEAYRRWKAPVGWTVEAFRQYVYGGAEPQRTASGVLVEDRMRDQKQVHHLTYRELRAALLGEIQVPHNHTDLVVQLRKRLGLSENHSEQRLLAELPNTSLEVSMDNTLLRAKLEEYKAAISRNPSTLTEKTAGDCQGMLYKAIRAVVKREFNEFVEGWNIVLDFVNENHATLFTPEKRGRGWSQVLLSKQQLQLFEDLLTLAIHTREPGNRAAMAKAYNLEIVLRHLPEENERQNLFMYYS